MKDKIEILLEQILAELQTMNARSDQVVQESEKQKASADQMLNNLFGMMPEPFRNTLKGGNDGQ